MASATQTDEMKKVVIFNNFTDDEIKTALDELSAVYRTYDKGSVILHAGSVTDKMGLVTEGSVTIENNDAWGNKTILSHVGKDGFFAETYAFLKEEPLMVDVSANEKCRILFLRIGFLRDRVSEKRPWTIKLLTNLLTISMQKNLALSGRSFIISSKTVRGRLGAYLNSVYLQKGTPEFDIPFDRQQLADYLNLDRTALSKEMGRMRDEGLISFRKNHFLINVTLYS